MAKINFVGFQEHVEIPAGFELVEINQDIPCGQSRDEVFSYLSQPEKISQWFYRVLSLETKSSGKVTYLTPDEIKSEAICIAYDGGREISLLADHFGEFTAKIKGGKSCTLSIKFRILTDNPKPIQDELASHINKLREIIG